MLQYPIIKDLAFSGKNRLGRTALAIFGSLWILGIGSTDLFARNWRDDQLPNGLVLSCANCHVNSNGAGARNPFGQAVELRVSFMGTEEFWDPSLAAMDSDGDGFTNGQEMGDPDGDFLNIGPVANVTHPGDPNSKPSNSKPSYTSSPVTAATEGVLYSYQASATDPESNPLTFSKVTGPAWLGVSTAGAVSGTPPAGVAGSHAVTIRVADNGSPALTADQSFTLVVSAAFAAWQTQNFTLPAENAIAAADQDPDGDGLPNLVEYALKTPPRQATALTLMSNRVFNGNGQLQFSQVVRDDDPKLSIKWEVNSVLPLGTPAVINAVISDPTPGDGLKTWTFTDTVSKNNATARFSRLKFEMLP